MVIFYLVLQLRHFIIEQLVLNEQNKTFLMAKITGILRLSLVPSILRNILV